MKLTKKWLIPLAIAVFALAAIPAALAFNPGADTPINSGQNPAGDQDSVGKIVNPSVPPSQDMVKELAPIDGVDIRVGESFPPQYFVHIAFGLPNGCVEPGGYEMERVGDEIHVKVSILKPAADDIVCTMIYGTGTYDVALGSDFESGETYAVYVNGEETTFAAQ